MSDFESQVYALFNANIPRVLMAHTKTEIGGLKVRLDSVDFGSDDDGLTAHCCYLLSYEVGFLCIKYTAIGSPVPRTLPTIVNDAFNLCLKNWDSIVFDMIKVYLNQFKKDNTP